MSGQEEPRVYRLPKDWHVPPSLRPHREMSDEEKARAKNSVEEFIVDRIREEARKHGSKKR